MSWIAGLTIVGVAAAICAYAIRDVMKRTKEPDDLSYKQRPFYTRPARTRTRTTSINQTIKLAMCPHCEATILAEATICPHCGSPRPTCMVCLLPIEFADAVLICPHCKGQAHRVHILEYLKVKGICPNCQADLDEFELIPKMSLDYDDDE
ncbi:MAG: zinc-ribbon domain-containing protein [Candidatus Odinarchaeota archaeon]